MRKILVIVDLQNDFIDGALANPAAKAIIPNVVNLINSNAKKYDKIICTLDTHYADYMYTVEGQNLPVAHCIKMTHGWLINSEIKDALSIVEKSDKEKVVYIEKNTFGAFELPYHIGQNMEDVEIDFVGTCTGVCVINNVALAKAANPNAVINVYENLCACVTPESHNRAIEQMKFNHINIEKWGA